MIHILAADTTQVRRRSAKALYIVKKDITSANRKYCTDTVMSVKQLEECSNLWAGAGSYARLLSRQICRLLVGTSI